MRARRYRVSTLLVAAGLAALAVSAADDPPVMKASALLPAAWIKGPHHQVAEPVTLEGYFTRFDVSSDFGAMPSESRSMLSVRLREVTALAALDDVSKSEVFLKSAGGAVVNVGKGVTNVVTNPGATVKGVGAGVKRVGMGLGRKSKKVAAEAKEAVEDDDSAAADAKSAGSKAADAGGSAVKSLAGVNAASRRWALKVGVDPYSTNAVLREALADIGKIDSAGSIAAKVVVPIPKLASTTASVNNLVWGKDPVELAKINAANATAIGVTPEALKAFMACKAFSPSRQTRLVSALFAVKAKNAGDYVDAASEAKTEAQAQFFTESAEMLQQLHATSPVSAVLADSKALVALTGDGSAVVLLPLDWVGWTDAARQALTEIDARARKELGAKAVRIETTGRFSSQAKKEMDSRGIKLVESVPGTEPSPVGQP